MLHVGLCLYAQDNSLNFDLHRSFYGIKNESKYANKNEMRTFSRTGFPSHWI